MNYINTNIYIYIYNMKIIYKENTKKYKTKSNSLQKYL